MTHWKPASGPAAASRRAQMLERARRYFSAQDVLAVDTPALSQYAASDPNIDSLTAWADPDKALFLHTSPEFCMKRLLASGYPDIYSICRVFRAGEAGRRHSPEFTMIEWYRLGFDLASIVDDTIGLIAACLDLPSLAESVAQYEYAEVFEEFAGVDVFDATIDQLSYVCTADEKLKSEIGVVRSAWLDLIMSTVIAPQFAADRLTVVSHYPAKQAALARLCPDDDRVADRYEIFYGDLELANGYVELTDVQEQQRRIGCDLETRQRNGRPVYPHDQRLIAALEAGLPGCAGVAVGAERLQMVLDQTDDIGDVVTFVPETS